MENDLGVGAGGFDGSHQPGIKTCLDAHDDATRELLEHFVVDEEGHIDWIETQQDTRLKKSAYENYLAQRIYHKG